MNLPGTLFQRPAGTLRARLLCRCSVAGGSSSRHPGETNLPARPISKAATCSRTKLRSVLDTRPFPDLFLQRPAGTLRVCSPSAQYGAGLYIVGTATLTDTNVYQNQASVGSGPSQTFPPRPAGTLHVLTRARLPGTEWSRALCLWRGQSRRLQCVLERSSGACCSRRPPLPGPYLQRPAELTVHPPLAGRGERWPILNQAT